MNLAILGSRGFDNYECLCEKIIPVVAYYSVTTIVSGGATGADSLAKRYARESNLQYIECSPDWKKYGKAAGYKRNLEIVTNSDYVIAFWDGHSSGTKHSIDMAKRQGKLLDVVYYKGENDASM